MKLKLDPEGYQPPRSGILFLQFLVGALFFVFVLRFWYLQIHKGKEFARQAQNNRLRNERVYASRGLIRDKNGILLAENRPAFGLALIREDCPDVSTTIAQVSAWMGVPLEQLLTKYNIDKRKVKPFEPILLFTDLPFEQVARIESQLMHWPGLVTLAHSKRYYPQSHEFAHILGYVAEANEKELSIDKALSLGDTIGKQGLEVILESRLRGDKGVYSVEVDVLGRALGKVLVKAPQHGEDIQLGLDAQLQKKIVSALDTHAACVVVIEPHTGRLQALVTTPSYDNNLFVGGLSSKNWEILRENPRHPLQNRTIQSTYPPASIWKLLMIGLFLEDGVSPSTHITCTGSVSLGDHIFRCWKKNGHGSVDMKQSLTESCDVYYYILGEKLGIDKIEQFAKNCGFGSLTTIDLPYEKTGIVPSRAWKRSRFGDSWYKGETLNTSIGQGYTLTTPLQIAVFVSSLLNGGNLMKPLLLSEDSPKILGKIPISEESRKFITNSMRLTAERGTAKILRRNDAVIGGKTGTAQVVKLKMVGDRRVKNDEMSYLERDHAWIASWGRKDDQDIVVVVMVEHGGKGGSAAGPIARKIYDILYSQHKPEQS